MMSLRGEGTFGGSDRLIWRNTSHPPPVSFLRHLPALFSPHDFTSELVNIETNANENHLL